jgi:HlyD family secretion protein
MLVNIIEGGAIQEIFVENGDMVLQDNRWRLYNPNAELAYMQQETLLSNKLII